MVYYRGRSSRAVSAGRFANAFRSRVSRMRRPVARPRYNRARVAYRRRTPIRRSFRRRR